MQLFEELVLEGEHTVLQDQFQEFHNLIFLSLVEKTRSFHSHKALATDMAKTDIRKHRTVKLWMLCAEVVEKRDTLRKSVSRLNVPHIHLRFHKLPPVLQGLVNPSTLMMMDTHIYTYG